MVAADPNPAMSYYLASVYARAGRKEEALRILEAMGTRGLPIIPDEADFASLARDERFLALVAAAQTAHGRLAASSLAFSLPQRELIPEGIAWDPASGDFFVGSIRQRKIVRVHLDGGVARSSDFAAFPAAPLYAVLGMKVDDQRGLLWVASYGSKGMIGMNPEDEGRASLVAFSIADGKVVSHDELREGKNLLNDVAIADDGTVYVTESEGASVYRKRSLTSPLEKMTISARLFYPNGIAVSSDQKFLYVAHFPRIVIIDRVTGTTEPLAEATGVVTGGIDGLYRSGDRLIAVMNGLGKPQIVSFSLSDDGRAAESMTVLENNAPQFAIPTTGAVARDAIYVIANSHLDALNEKGELDPGAVREPEILRVPLQREPGL